MILLASITFFPTIGQATTTTYSYGNLTCSAERGTDVLFVINDSDAMLKVDINMSLDPAVTETYISEAIAYTKNLATTDRVGVIGFNDRVVKHADLTTNRYDTAAALQTFLTKDENTRGGNDLSIGISTALDEFQKSNSTNDKVIIVMTTGHSINNEKSLELARLAYEQDVTIQTFGFGSGQGIDEGNLGKIARTTGGEYYHSTRAIDLRRNFASLKSSIVGFTGRTVSSDWKLTQDVTETKGLLIQDNVKVDLNGYKLTVQGDLILQPCAQLRAVSRSVITATNIEQKKGSMIALSNSQLNVQKEWTQNGLLQVNSDFGGEAAEVIVNTYNQQLRGVTELKGRTMTVTSNFNQEGRMELDGGKVTVKGNMTQKGFFNINKGQLYVEGNLYVNGDSLRDDAFTENRSLNVGGGLVQVGSAASMEITRDKGNLHQTSGQLYVNDGTVRVFGDYLLTDGWLTMIKGSMDTTVADYGEDDGDYVHVYRDFLTSSQRNHAQKSFNYLTKPSNDQGHLTDGVLRVDGNFTQVGNKEFDKKYSDRSQNYTEDYSRFNFAASGRHKVLLTGNGNIQVEGTGFTFQNLEVDGLLTNYTTNALVKWKNLIERTKSSNANLRSLSINNIAVNGFNPNTANYPRHVVPAVQSNVLLVDARPEDRNAKVAIYNNAIVDNKARVLIVVTAPGGSTMQYTVHVTVGEGTDGRVTSIELHQKSLSFMEQVDYSVVPPQVIYSPGKVTIGHTIYPKTAANQQVIWMSTNEAVATVRDGIVTPVGIGQATIVATTVDGNFVDSANVEVLAPYDLLEGINTLADLVLDNERYNRIMALYKLDEIGIVVPGQYIKSITFAPNQSGYLISGNIEVDSRVKEIVVSVNGQKLPVANPGNGSAYTFSRAGLTVNDYIEVFAFNLAGDELERIATNYPVGFVPDQTIPFGFNSIQTLFDNPYLFDLILEYYSLDQLRFEAR